MATQTILNWPEALRSGVEKVRQAKRAQTRVDAWFYVQEVRMEAREAMVASGDDPDSPLGQARLLCRLAEGMPLSILNGAAVAGSQDGAFSPSYALINPSFRVEDFGGYCDPTVIYNDVTPLPEEGLTAERIAKVRAYWADQPFVRKLDSIYEQAGDEAREVVYFMEPVTGHTIPDLRPYLIDGVRSRQAQARREGNAYGLVMAQALEAPLILARRYAALAREKAAGSDDRDERARLERMAAILDEAPGRGARTLHEAVQIFVLLWMTLTLEQAPNPYAFSVGNLDRILAPWYREGETDRAEAVELVRNILTFLQVGARCWAISQNVMVGGRDADGADQTNPMTEVVLDAFYETNDPQPALSVKVHAHTPESLWRSLGRFFFTPGHSTPSLFNDDTLFENLSRQGVKREDLADYAIAGCQEPLIMGKASLNTTNTWLNLGKVLELTLNDGRSLITDKQIGPTWASLGYDGVEAVMADLEAAFFKVLDWTLPRMARAGNACVRLLGEEKPVPFTSAVMDSFYTGRDLRDPNRAGTRYHASGCLIHGLSVVCDSIHAVERALASGLWSGESIRSALRANYEGHEAVRDFLRNQEKFGNNHAAVDDLACRIAAQVSDRVTALRNDAGAAYLADWSTPSTHLLYGYWVGATPDGRSAREMLGYGLDPRPDATRSELPERFVSAWKLPYLKMTGGYASHIGLDPSSARRDGTASMEDGGLWMRDHIIAPLFRLGDEANETPYYVYFNIDRADRLRDVLAHPETYAPNGVYIMRIHGTFVNFLDLSPAIQEDIIQRLDAGSALS